MDRIAYHYDLAQAAYEAHDYDEASIQIGLMSHYAADIAEPFQTHMGGIPLGDQAKKYEQLVAPLHRDKNDTPEWSSSRRTVSEIENVRDTAAGTAAYSRQFFKELHDRLKNSNFHLTDRVSEITGLVFKRATNDLADLIWSITQGVGAQPAVGEIELDHQVDGRARRRREHGLRPGLRRRRAPDRGAPGRGRLADADGNPDRAAVHAARRRQKRHRPVGTSPKLVLRPVTATAEVRGDAVVAEAHGRSRHASPAGTPASRHRRRCDRHPGPGRHRHEHCPRCARRPGSEPPRHVGPGTSAEHDRQDPGLHEWQRRATSSKTITAGMANDDRDHGQDPGGLHATASDSRDRAPGRLTGDVSAVAVRLGIRRPLGSLRGASSRSAEWWS